MIQAPGVTVNGVKITAEQINAEVQYHPAPSLPEAKYQAMQALVIRELLLQEAQKHGLGAGGHEPPDEIIDLLLEREIRVNVPSREECQRYYNNNKGKFFTDPLFQVSHILYLAPPEDAQAREAARERAAFALARLQEKPDSFESIARAESACSSGRNGGHLGQVGMGQTLPDFEKALLSMKAGDVSGNPVATDVGYHIIKVHERADGSLMPFESVAALIADSLQQECWRRAFSQYAQILAGQAEISGFRLKGADTPLVQ